MRRRLRFLETMEAVMLANHRKVPPFGLAGGKAALPGRNYLERGDGTVEEMEATDRRSVSPGDVFVLETPGGGGYGEASDIEA